MGIWSVLGIEPTQDLRIIKRAYARQLKNSRPDQDPEGYQRLREAFESAKRGEQFWNFSDDVTFSAHPSPQVELTSLSMPLHFDMPGLPAAFDESLLQQTQVSDNVSETVSLLLKDEDAGMQLLSRNLSGDLLQNLKFREMFSQQMAWELAEREGLYPELLVKVAARMEWEIDHYQPEGISHYQLQALHQQIENTSGNRYWASLRAQYQNTRFRREAFELLSVEGKTISWWMKCIPGFTDDIRMQQREIELRHPALLPQINSRLEDELARCRFALSGETAFLVIFWCVLSAIGARHSAHWLRDSVLSAATVLGCIFGYKGIHLSLHHRPRLLAVAEAAASLLMIALAAKVFSGFYGLFIYLQDDPGRGPALFFMLLVTVLFCTWAISPRSWRWYNLVSNSVIALLTLPWQQARKPGWFRRIIACVVMLFFYSRLITWAVA